MWFWIRLALICVYWIKVHEKHLQDRIKNGEHSYIINTISRGQLHENAAFIRRSAHQYNIHYDTTLKGGFLITMSLNIYAISEVISVQEMHEKIIS